MKRSVKIIAAVAAAAVLALTALTSCINIANTYDHADMYSAGDVEVPGDIEELDIDWSSGSVTVSRHDSDTVSVTETCKEKLDDEQKVHTWLEGKVLHIRYCKSGAVFTLNNAEKKLDIKLPKDLTLKKLGYDGTSGDSVFENISADSFKIDISSGSADLIGCTSADFDLDASSGDLSLDQKGSSDRITADVSSGSIKIKAETAGDITTECTSGSIDITVGTAKTVSADTSSGKINITADKADSVTTDATSGNTELRLANMPANTKLEATSGDIELFIPENSDFKCDVTATSGDFDSDLSLSKNGDTYTAGAGTNSVTIDTTSGDVKIKKL